MKKLPKVGDVVWIANARVSSGVVHEVQDREARVGPYWYFPRDIFPTKQAALVAAAVRKEKGARNDLSRCIRQERLAASALALATRKKDAAQALLTKATKAVKAAKEGR